MKLRLLALVLTGLLSLDGAALAQSSKSGDKKAPAKAPVDPVYDAFEKVRKEPGGKMDQARFQRVVAAGMEFLMKNPTHARAGDAVRDLAFFGRGIDAKEAPLRTAYASLLKLDVTRSRYAEGLSDPAKAVLAALDAAVADNDVREAFNPDNLATLREKIDTLAETPGGARFLVERERSYVHILQVGTNLPRAEAHLKKLLEHPDKAVVTMAREELNTVELKKEPFALKFTALDGKEVDFAQLRGKVVALYFWSSGNTNSTRNFDGLKQIYANYRKRGLEFVTVSYDKEEDRAKLTKFVKDNRIAWPVYFDGKGAKNDFSPKLGVSSVPRLLVFDQKGLLQTTMQGSPVGRLQADLPPNQLEGMTKKLLGIK
jgi:peroxiredoxin